MAVERNIQYVFCEILKHETYFEGLLIWSSSVAFTDAAEGF